MARKKHSKLPGGPALRRFVVVEALPKEPRQEEWLVEPRTLHDGYC